MVTRRQVATCDSRRRRSGSRSRSSSSSSSSRRGSRNTHTRWRRRGSGRRSGSERGCRRGRGAQGEVSAAPCQQALRSKGAGNDEGGDQTHLSSCRFFALCVCMSLAVVSSKVSSKVSSNLLYYLRLHVFGRLGQAPTQRWWRAREEEEEERGS